jgi:rhodanese-related sulfurtransferase
MSTLSGVSLAKENKALAKMHEKIERQFPHVQHLDANNPILTRTDGIVVFDVREEKEYAVSHLENAIRIDPGISTEDFMEEFADRTQGKGVVFYCSVGQRSSRLADRTQGPLIAHGAKSAYNLEGGIFKWHNEQRSLLSIDATPTDVVHPYNAYWGRMVNDRSKTSYTIDK